LIWNPSWKSFCLHFGIEFESLTSKSIIRLSGICDWNIEYLSVVATYSSFSGTYRIVETNHQIKFSGDFFHTMFFSVWTTYSQFQRLDCWILLNLIIIFFLKIGQKVEIQLSKSRSGTLSVYNELDSMLSNLIIMFFIHIPEIGIYFC
jgi:hypothetical protein